VRFINERENAVLDSLIYLAPVEIFQNKSNMMKFSSYGDSTSGIVEAELKTIGLSCRQIE
jgi:hypothetical protein